MTREKFHKGSFAQRGMPGWILFSRCWWRRELTLLTLERTHENARRAKDTFDKPEDEYCTEDERNKPLPLPNAYHQS